MHPYLSQKQVLDLLDLLDDFASTDKATDVNHLTTKSLGTREI